jgi:hypothetical protein
MSPFKSESQRKFMYANNPEMAKRWEKETPKGKKLPNKVKTKVQSKMAKKRQ